VTRGLRFALLLTTLSPLFSFPASAQEAAVGSSLPETFLRDLPSSNNLFQVLETVEGEIISDRF
jgi:hypothetical protein